MIIAGIKNGTLPTVSIEVVIALKDADRNTVYFVGQPQ
jgi:hypothetical protein